MYNWSTDERHLQKDPEQHTIWKLEQMINFGLDGEKISKKDLRRYWNRITIDPARRKFLEQLLNE